MCPCGATGHNQRSSTLKKGDLEVLYTRYEGRSGWWFTSGHSVISKTFNGPVFPQSGEQSLRGLSSAIVGIRNKKFILAPLHP
jgi:hypothetical protein